MTHMDALEACIPPEYKSQVQELVKQAKKPNILEVILAFASGGPCPENASTETRSNWKSQSDAFAASLKTNKRAREDGESSGSKRQKVEEEVEEDAPVFMLCSVSTTSPVRKKVNLTIHNQSIRLTNPTTDASLAQPIPLSSITRAFLLPTRGKQKPHWTVVLMTVDTANKGEENVQVIFGLDAQSTTAMTTVTHPAAAVATPKGASTIALIRTFLSFLPGVTLFEPKASVFTSACLKEVPGVEAYRAAKEGTLWFMPEGVLWGEAKACEFWPCQDLMGKDDGLRMISATGRTCSVILGRRLPPPEVKAEDNEEEEDEGVETEFAMIDGREQDPIKEWVRKYSRLFGKKLESGVPAAAAVDANNDLDARSDASDDSFEGGSSDDGGSDTSSSGGEDAGGDAEGAAEESGAEDEEEEEDGGELKPENHPLMRPGAMPRMSRAAVDMVVGMMEDELMGGGDEDDDELMD